jgi:hypothetical protein
MERNEVFLEVLVVQKIIKKLMIRIIYSPPPPCSLLTTPLEKGSLVVWYKTK